MQKTPLEIQIGEKTIATAALQKLREFGLNPKDWRLRKMRSKNARLWRLHVEHVESEGFELEGTLLEAARGVHWKSIRVI